MITFGNITFKDDNNAYTTTDNRVVVEFFTSGYTIKRIRVPFEYAQIWPNDCWVSISVRNYNPRIQDLEDEERHVRLQNYLTGIGFKRIKVNVIPYRGVKDSFLKPSAQS